MNRCRFSMSCLFRQERNSTSGAMPSPAGDRAIFNAALSGRGHVVRVGRKDMPTPAEAHDWITARFPAGEGMAPGIFSCSRLIIALFLALLAPFARAYVDITPSLGRIVNES